MNRRALGLTPAVLILYFFTLVAVAVGVAVGFDQRGDISQTVNDQANADKRQRKESRRNRSQNCRSFESAHLQEIVGLEQSYKFLTGTPRNEWDTTQKFVFGQLGSSEKDAKNDRDDKGAQVPKYCDAPGSAAEKRGVSPVGLREPDRPLPKRPGSLR